MGYTTLLPDGYTLAYESTSTAASNAAKPLSHLDGWNVLCSFSEASRTHPPPLTECSGKADDHPMDEWQWSKTTRRNRFVSSAKST